MHENHEKLWASSKSQSERQTDSFCKEASITKQISERQKRNSAKYDEDFQ